MGLDCQEKQQVIELMSAIFKSLGEPTRLTILLTLIQGEKKVESLAAIMGVSSSTISHHLRVLRNLRVVKYRRQGRHVYYNLDDEHIKNIVLQGLAHVKEDEV